MAPYPAALDLPHALIERVTRLIVTREGGHGCKLPPHQRALFALVYLRRHDTLAKIAVSFGISTAPAYTAAAINRLAGRAPGLLRALREADPDCDCVGARSRAPLRLRGTRPGGDAQLGSRTVSPVDTGTDMDAGVETDTGTGSPSERAAEGEMGRTPSVTSGTATRPRLCARPRPRPASRHPRQSGWPARAAGSRTRQLRSAAWPYPRRLAPAREMQPPGHQHAEPRDSDPRPQRGAGPEAHPCSGRRQPQNGHRAPRPTRQGVALFVVMPAHVPTSGRLTYRIA